METISYTDLVSLSTIKGVNHFYLLLLYAHPTLSVAYPLSLNKRYSQTCCATPVFVLVAR